MSACAARFLEAIRQVARQREQVEHCIATHGRQHPLTRAAEQALTDAQALLVTLNDCGG